MTVTDAPLAATLARAMALDPLLLAADLGPLEPGWFSAAALPDPDSPALAEGLTRNIARYPHAEQRVAGSFYSGRYVWYLMAAAAGAYLADGRAPDLAPDNVALRYRTCVWEGGSESERIDVRFLGGRFATLPHDPAAGHPDALVLPDADALRAWLRAGLEAHIEPLFSAVTARTNLGAPAQWRLAADSVAWVFLEAGKRLGCPERGQAEGLAFVKVAGSRLCNPRTGYLTVEAEGHCETFTTRGGCCLFYRVEPGNNCAACVLRSRAEQAALLRARVLEQLCVQAVSG